MAKQGPSSALYFHLFDANSLFLMCYYYYFIRLQSMNLNVFFYCCILLYAYHTKINLFIYSFIYLFIYLFIHSFIYSFIYLFIGSNNAVGEISGPKSVANFRVNQNRILLLEIASFLDILPEIKSKKNQKFSSKNVEKENLPTLEKGEKDVEKEVENSRNQLKTLFNEGWTISTILNFLAEKIVRKGEN